METKELEQLCWNGNTLMIQRIIQDNPTLYIAMDIDNR